ncbi:MAG: hypothetical protein K2I61_06450, partial [Muribaculaceae bacterium]|nr:hypothetical protein [Muribaculaceae bacterium]
LVSWGRFFVKDTAPLLTTPINPIYRPLLYITLQKNHGSIPDWLTICSTGYGIDLKSRFNEKSSFAIGRAGGSDIVRSGHL